MAERHELADQVLVILKRAWPAEVEKEDLIEQAGLPPDDLRGALDSLREANELDESGSHFAWLNPDDPERTGDGPAPTPDPDEPEANAAPSRTELPDHSGRTVRVTLELVGSFAPGRGQTDEAMVSQAQKVAEEVGNVLGRAIPALGANVGVKRVDVYDSPRPVFDADQSADEDDGDR